MRKVCLVRKSTCVSVIEDKDILTEESGLKECNAFI